MTWTTEFRIIKWATHEYMIDLLGTLILHFFEWILRVNHADTGISDDCTCPQIVEVPGFELGSTVWKPGVLTTRLWSCNYKIQVTSLLQHCEQHYTRWPAKKERKNIRTQKKMKKNYYSKYTYCRCILNRCIRANRSRQNQGQETEHALKRGQRRSALWGN